HEAGTTTVAPTVDLARQPLSGAQRPDLSVCPSQVDLPQTRTLGPSPGTQTVHQIHRRLDEEHPADVPGPEQSSDEVLVASPHLVPRLERDHHKVCHDSTAL